MEIKHTIEILTKDIQDIEKLVRNLNNYPTPPQIELDLALSRLRHVYELLSIIANDARDERKSMDTTFNIPEETAPVPPPVQAAPVPEPPPAPPVVEEQEPELHVPEAVKEKVPEPEPEPETQEEINVPEKVDIQESEENSKPVHEEIQAATVSAEKKNAQAKIVAEKFEKDTSLNERIATGRTSDLGSKLTGGPIDSIRRNIGINDRFLIIREVMNGDNEAFNQFIQRLDECADFNEAFHQLESRFPDQLEHDGIRILIDLTRRKFISQENV